MLSKNTKAPKRKRKHYKQIVVGSGKDLQFKPEVWEQWNEDACDADVWKHGRVSSLYRNGYNNIKWDY